eukprot:scaffold264157_cov17-Tisochrysis_lutea.AAC.1
MGWKSRQSGQWSLIHSWRQMREQPVGLVLARRPCSERNSAGLVTSYKQGLTMMAAATATAKGVV